MLFENLKKNIYSQNGEDGIIEFILSKIEVKDGWCCEFGAWDGKHLSNTFNLVSNKNYNAVYIEGDDEKFKDLLKTTNEFKSIVPINSWVEIDGLNSLDNILSRTKIPLNFDILSIDIDGLDYLIWESFVKYKPKIVVIEINSAFDPQINFSEDDLRYDVMLSRSGGPRSGINFKTCFDLGKSKGYRLFTHTGNLIFIDNYYEDIFTELATESNYLDYFFRKWI